MSDIDVLLSYGHGEYQPPFPGGTTAEVWPPPLNEAEYAEFEDWLFDFAGQDEIDRAILRDKWVEVTELPAERMPDEEIDLTWEKVVHVRCSRADFEQTFERFLVEIEGADPSGDDDVFDYWPSGARLLIAMAKELGPDYETRAIESVRRVVLDDIASWGVTELLEKTGTWRDEDAELSEDEDDDDEGR